MWYASPAEPCGTAMARLSAALCLNASASFSSCAHVFGTFASRVLTTSPTFSSAYGAPYRRPPYENASSAYFGNCFLIAFVGNSGTTRPFAARSPVQSCAATMTSGAFSGLTVFRSSRIVPNEWYVTFTSTPRLAPHADVILSTAGFCTLSTQIVSLAGAFELARAVEVARAPARASTTAMTTASRTASRLPTFIDSPPPPVPPGHQARRRLPSETCLTAMKQQDPKTPPRKSQDGE